MDPDRGTEPSPSLPQRPIKSPSFPLLPADLMLSPNSPWNATVDSRASATTRASSSLSNVATSCASSFERRRLRHQRSKVVASIVSIQKCQKRSRVRSWMVVMFQGVISLYKFFGCQMKRKIVILAGKKIGWMWWNLGPCRLMTWRGKKNFQMVSKETIHKILWK